MPERARFSATDAEIDRALAQARAYEKYARRVVKAVYLKRTDRLRLVFDDGAIYILPRRLIQGLPVASEYELGRIQILNYGTGLLWPLLDVSHHVQGLLDGVYGSARWMASLHKQKRKLSLVVPPRKPRQR